MKITKERKRKQKEWAIYADALCCVFEHDLFMDWINFSQGYINSCDKTYRKVVSKKYLDMMFEIHAQYDNLPYMDHAINTLNVIMQMWDDFVYTDKGS